MLKVTPKTNVQQEFAIKFKKITGQEVIQISEDFNNNAHVSQPRQGDVLLNFKFSNLYG
jgi:hypothetical protein